jgi:outer membrane murein-binding lipoprotein Lpp
MNTISKIVIGVMSVTIVSGCSTTDTIEPTRQASTSSDSFAALLLGGRMSAADVDVAATKAQKFALGTENNPVRAHAPQGQRAYLSRLKCSDGSRPQFNRAGSFGAGPYGSIIDGYALTCGGQRQDGLIFMDMYHPGHQEDEAVPGYTID